MKGCTRKPEECRKRLFDSVDAARMAHGRAGFRLRIYPSQECCGRTGYHVANGDKRQPTDRWSKPSNRPGKTLHLAPERTLYEVEQIAAGMRAARG